jgi:RNA polymerase sigma-70 factor (ECF subfamily)
MSYDEIARELELSRHTVRNLLNLALKDIRNYLLQHGDIAGVVILIFILK